MNMGCILIIDLPSALWSVRLPSNLQSTTAKNGAFILSSFFGKNIWLSNFVKVIKQLHFDEVHTTCVKTTDFLSLIKWPYVNTTENRKVKYLAITKS